MLDLITKEENVNKIKLTLLVAVFGVSSAFAQTLSKECIEQLVDLPSENPDFNLLEFVKALPKEVAVVKGKEKSSGIPVLGGLLGPGPDDKKTAIGMTVGCAKQFPMDAGGIMALAKDLVPEMAKAIIADKLGIARKDIPTELSQVKCFVEKNAQGSALQDLKPVLDALGFLGVEDEGCGTSKAAVVAAAPKTANAKAAAKNNAADQGSDDLEKERLAIEKEKLALEREKLAMEREKLQKGKKSKEEEEKEERPRVTRYGILAELYSVGEIDDPDYDNNYDSHSGENYNFGFGFGVIAEKPISRLWSAVAGVKFINREVDYYGASAKENLIGIPVGLKVMPFGGPIFYMTFGAQVDFIISSKVDDYDIGKDRDDVDIGFLCVPLGWHIGNHFALELGVVVGPSPLPKASSGTTFGRGGFTLTYRF